MTPPAPFRVDIRIRNNRIIVARERLGYKSAARAAAALNIPYTYLVRYESMAMSPLGKDGAWLESAKQVADGLFSSCEDLWPDEAINLVKNRMSIEATFEQLVRQFGESPERRLLVAADQMLLNAAISKLTKIETEIIVRTVVGDETQADVALDRDLSHTRIGQLRDGALGKLRKALENDDPIKPAEPPTKPAKRPKCGKCDRAYDGDGAYMTSFQDESGKFHYRCWECR